MTDRHERVDDPSDPRLADYVALNDPQHRRQVERRGGYFIVEGVVAIERLLANPQWSVRSVLLLDTLANRLTHHLRAIPAAVLVAPSDVLRSVVGFDLHRGALAAVDRPAGLPAPALIAQASLLLITEGLNDHENLGALFRNAAAFDVDGVLLDPTTADPLYRRSVRVSTGHVLDVPFASIGPLPDGLDVLRDAGATVVALTPSLAAPDLRDISRRDLANPVALLVGAEGPGLSAPSLAAADLRCRIPMAPGIDSLNVATAAAVALFHLSGTT
ncbi:MAG: RNA methyltransferase [Actinomycetota bacterium]|nr:RNA methyltransferase [Actinomycetota bacterium]